MSNTAINRQIVQDGLDRRAEDAKRREAALEADARILRLKINDNHAKTCVYETMPYKGAQKPQEATMGEDAAKYASYEETRTQEVQACKAWYQVLIRVFAPMFVAVFAVSCFTNRAIPLWLMVPVAIAGITLSVLTAMVWVLYQWMKAHNE